MRALDQLIAANLRRLREQYALSQQALADMIGIDKSKISAWENGHAGVGKLWLEKLCTALKVRPYEFYIEPSTPIAENDQEMQHLLLYREARQLGLADEIDRYTRYTVEHEKSRRAEAHDQNPSVHARARQTGQKRGKRSA
jgi:transcriptional regulator with XRE-family HTH domain